MELNFEKTIQNFLKIPLINIVKNIENSCKQITKIIIKKPGNCKKYSRKLENLQKSLRKIIEIAELKY